MDYQTIAQLAKKGATMEQLSKLSAAGLSLPEIQSFYGVQPSQSSTADLSAMVKAAVQEAMSSAPQASQAPQGSAPNTQETFAQMFARTFPNADVPPERDVQQILSDRFAGLIGGDSKN